MSPSDQIRSYAHTVSSGWGLGGREWGLEMDFNGMASDPISHAYVMTSQETLCTPKLLELSGWGTHRCQEHEKAC